MPRRALAASVVETYYVPIPEDQLRTVMVALQGSSIGTTMTSVTSIVVTGDNTVIYFDHWEDGYEVDIEHPTQASTRVWGDGNIANGCAPGHACATNADDVLTAGEVIALRNDVVLPRNPSNLFYDGHDKFAATKALAVTRAGWAVNPGTVLASAVDVPAVRDYGTTFKIPVGQNITTGSMYGYVGAVIMAAQDGTAVTIDIDGGGATAPFTVTLNQGQSYQVSGGIQVGATVSATKPVMVQAITGRINGNYESRSYTIAPTTQWGSSYYTPVGTTSSATDGQTFIFLFNPNASALTINYATKSGTGSFSVSAGTAFQFLMPAGSGGHFYSSGSPFFAYAAVAASPTSNNVHDWGFALVPETFLTTQAVVGWGPGSGDLSVNGSPVWVTAVNPTTVYVDYDGNPATGSQTDPRGHKYDVALNLAALDSVRVFDPDKDQTGMKLYTLNGTLITAAWGEDPATAGAGNPFLDMGTTVRPFPVAILTKTSRITTDTPPIGFANIGDVIEYTIKINNAGVLVLGNLVVIDAPPAPLVYVPNSTTLNGNPIPDDGNGFPLDSPGYTIPIINPGGFAQFQYSATVTAAGSVVNTATVSGGGDVLTDSNSVPTNGTICTLSFTDSSGSPVTTYAANGLVYVTVTDNDTKGLGPITVLVTDATTGDSQTLSLTETSVNSGIFRNTTSLPLSQTTGQAAQDGTLYALIGNSFHATHSDSINGDSCASTPDASIPMPSLTKQLYLRSDGVDNDTTGSLTRVDPVHFTPLDTIASASAALSTSGSSGTYLDHFGSASYSNNDGTLTWSGSWVETNDGAATSPTAGDIQIISGELQFHARNATQDIDRGLNLSGATSATLTFHIRASGGHENNDTFTVEASGDGTTYSTISPVITLDTVEAAGAGGQNKSYTIPAGDLTANARIRFAHLASDTGSPGEQTFVDDVTVTVASLGNTSATFTQTPVMAGTLSLPSGGAVSVTTCIAVTGGAMPGSPSISAALKKNGSAFPSLTLSGATYNASGTTCGGPQLTWSGNLTGAVSLGTSDVASLLVTTAQAGVAFTIQYDSNSKPSQISLPTTTVINVDSLGVYDSPSPGGTLITGGNNGQHVYVRAVVSDPFGPADITSLSLTITDPNNVASTVTPSVVATGTNTKTFEYEWDTPATPGSYQLSVIANEGYEGTITATRGAQFPLTFQDLGTPSVTEFTTGNSGASTPSYGGAEQVCVRVTDLDQDTSAGIDTVTAVITSSNPADSYTITLTETAVHSGIFTGCVPHNTSDNNPANSTLGGALGAILTVNYSDPNDPTDHTSATATIPNTVAAVAITKTLVTPSSGRAHRNDAVQFDLVVTNTGNTSLATVQVVDTYPSCLTFNAAGTTPAASSSTSSTITWTNVGPLSVGASTTLHVAFTGSSSVACSPGTNSASVSGTASAGPATATVNVTNPQLSVSKVLTSPAPPSPPAQAPIGSTVTFQMTVQNTGSTIITTLPLSDSFNTCLSYSGGSPAADAVGSGLVLWNNLGPLGTGASKLIAANFTVIGACNPAMNTADVSYATDANSDPVPPDSSSATVLTQAADISGAVYNDANANGALDGGEAGLSGVTVRLYTDPNGDGNPADGTVVAVATTDSSGSYDFISLNIGHYVVVETDPTGYTSTGDTAGVNDNLVPVNVSSLTSFANNNFFDTASTNAGRIADYVWFDTNQNGIQDPSEKGIAGVTVNLRNSAGTTVLRTTQSDGSGFYTFDSVPAGSYVVEFVKPTGYSFTTQDVGGNSGLADSFDSDANSSTGRTAVVTVTGAGLDTVDAGMYLTGGAAPARIADRVWYDSNQDGIQTGGEPGIAGVTVNLYDSTGTTLMATTVTDGSGAYEFAGLPAGTYQVEFVAPGGYTISPQNAGGDATKDSNPNPATGFATLAVVAGQNNADMDAGMYIAGVSPARIGDRVWYDTNGDGLQTAGEPGLPGVVVDLYDNFGQLLATAHTDTSGTYEFAGLAPGNYAVGFVAPTGYSFGTALVGADRTVDSDPDPLTGRVSLTLAAGENNTTVDAALRKPGSNPISLGDLVWLDANFSNTFNAGEGASGVTVVLYDGDGNVLARMPTDANGSYTFTGLAPGDFRVAVDTSTLPAGAPQIADPDATLDGRTDLVNQTTSIASVDFGYQPAPVVDVTTTVSFPASATASSTVNGTVSYANNGPSTAVGVAYTLQLPAGLTGVSIFGDATGVYDSVTGVVTLSGLPSSLSAGGSPTVDVSYTAPTSGSVTVNSGISTTTNQGANVAPDSAAATTTITPTADVTTTVTFPASAIAGSTVSGTVTYANNGPSSAAGIGDTLQLAPGLSGVTVSGDATGVYSPATGIVTLTGLPANMTPGAELAVDVSYTAPGSGSVTVTSGISTSTDQGANVAPDMAAATTTFASTADVTTTTNFPATANAGSTVTGAVTYANNGPSTAAGVGYSLQLATGLSGVTISGGATGVYNPATGVVALSGLPGTLNPGASSTVIVSYTAPASGSVTVTCGISTVTSQGANIAPDAAAATTTITPIADVTTTANFPASANAGSTVSGTVTYANNGPSTATGVGRTLQLPTGLSGVTISGGATGVYNSATGIVTFSGLPTSLSPGARATVNVSYTAPTSGSVTVTSGISTATNQGVNGAPDAAATTTTINAVADVTTTVSLPTTATVGATVSSTVTFANHGPSTAAGVTYTLAMTPGLSGVSFPALPPGAGANYNAATGAVTLSGMPTSLASGTTLSIGLTFNASASGSVSVNSAIGTTTSQGPNTLPDSASATMTLVAPTHTPTPTWTPTPLWTPTYTWSPTLTWTPTPTATIAPDLALTKMHGAPFSVGKTGLYTLTVTNIGGSTSGPITLTDSLPTGLTFVSAGGGGWSCSPFGQTVICTNPGPLGPGATSSIALTVFVGSAAFPTITNTASVSTAGDSKTRNNTASDPTTVKAGVPATAPPTATLPAPNTPTPRSPNPTHTPASGPTATTRPAPTRTATATPRSAVPCDQLVISKSHSGSARPGRAVEFQLRWSGNNCSQASGVVVTDTLPAGLTVISASAAAGIQVNVSGNTVTFATPLLSGVGSATINAQVGFDLPANARVCNIATIADVAGHSAQSEDCLRVMGTVARQRLVLKGHNKSRPGRQLTYTARYYDITSDNVLTLTVPPHVTVIAVQGFQPTSVDGLVYTWVNLPIISGLVRVTVQLDDDLAYGTVLPASAELIDGKGTEEVTHTTTVVVPASAGQNSTQS